MSQPTTITINFRKIFRSFVVAVTVCLLLGSPFVAHQLYYKYVLAKTNDYLARGFPSLAADYIQSRQNHFSRDAAGCKALLNAYQGSHNLSKMRWAVENCAQNGVNIAESLMTLAQLSMSDGDAARSAAFLKKAVEKYKSVPAYLGLIAMATHDNNREEAVRLIREALQALPDSNEIKWEAVHVFMDYGDNSQALMQAMSLQVTMARSSDLEFKNELEAIIVKLKKLGADPFGGMGTAKSTQHPSTPRNLQPAVKRQ